MVGSGARAQERTTVGRIGSAVAGRAVRQGGCAGGGREGLEAVGADV